MTRVVAWASPARLQRIALSWCSEWHTPQGRHSMCWGWSHDHPPTSARKMYLWALFAAAIAAVDQTVQGLQGRGLKMKPDNFLGG